MLRDFRIGENFGDGADRRTRDAAFHHGADGGVAGLSFTPSTDHRVDLFDDLQASDNIFESRIRCKFFAGKQFKHRTPVWLGNAHDHHLATIARRVNIAGTNAAAAVAETAKLLTIEHRRNQAGERGYAGIVHRDFNFLAMAGALTLHQCSKNSGGQVDAGCHVDEGRRRLGAGRYNLSR